MGIVLDLIVVAIVALCVIISIKRGFMKTAIELVGFVLAVYVAFNFGPVLSGATYDKLIKNPVSDKISTTITEFAQEGTADVTNAVWDKCPEFFKENADVFGVSLEKLQSDISLGDKLDTNAIAENITDSVVKPIATTALNAVYSILLFLIIAIITKFLSKPINKLFSISFIGKINKTLGGVLGFGKGIVFAIIFCAVISSIVIFTKSGFLIFTKENIEASTIFELLCKINPIY